MKTYTVDIFFNNDGGHMSISDIVSINNDGIVVSYANNEGREYMVPVASIKYIVCDKK